MVLITFSYIDLHSNYISLIWLFFVSKQIPPPLYRASPSPAPSLDYANIYRATLDKAYKVNQVISWQSNMIRVRIHAGTHRHKLNRLSTLYSFCWKQCNWFSFVNDNESHSPWIMSTLDNANMNCKLPIKPSKQYQSRSIARHWLNLNLVRSILWPYRI